ncbi:MAG: heavy-metal-associated domain-containing protein [Gemmatimonadota bacterium]
MTGSNLLTWSAAGLMGVGAICPLCAATAADAGPGGVSVDPATRVAVASLPNSEPLREIAPAPAGDSTRVRLAIEGMTCGSCATTARIILRRIRGVYDAEVSYDSAGAVVLYDADLTGPETFIAELARMAGYEASVVGEPERLQDRPGREEGPGA